jgi:hypothetical protein
MAPSPRVGDDVKLDEPPRRTEPKEVMARRVQADSAKCPAAQKLHNDLQDGARRS